MDLAICRLPPDTEELTIAPPGFQGELRIRLGESEIPEQIVMLSIDERENDGVTILELTGRLVFGADSQSLNQLVKRLVAERKTRILVNLAGISFIDSCGVGELVASLSTVKKSDGVLKAAAPTAIVREVLRIVRVTKIIDIYNTEAEALASFK
jgi:anti-sigma B factor antagonist